VGIIVTLAMFGGLVLLLPTPWQVSPERPRARGAVGAFLLFTGFWNSAWYGLQHISEFWGVVGLVSGTIMIASAIFILRHSPSCEPNLNTATARMWRWSLCLALGLCFLLYAITLVQLNLGMSIIK